MNTREQLLLENWTVDFGEGHVECVRIPHAWRQEVPVTFEGPVLYRTETEAPRSPSILRFHGVSYQAEVFIEGSLVATHRGIWDAFDVALTPFAGRRIKIEVRVIKNGGRSFPVKDVASGFLPYVYHTFGGIFGEVEILSVDEARPLESSAAPQRVTVTGHKVFVDGKPFFARGLLTWGWYPEVGHTNPPEEAIRAEVRAAKSLGFNLIKFCLWVPPHRYLEILREEGMLAWMELPLWDPSGDPDKLQAISEEIERIVRQYRGHDNVLCWTIGCELSHATPPEYRARMVQLVKNLTGSPLVKDNSGGAEMYGGDLREFGDFDDFHPYCDLPFYSLLLDSLEPGPRPDRPVLLGEFNDIDVHRDYARLADALPFWASRMPELNDKGVRWQQDLPFFLPESRFALEPRKNKHLELLESSRRKAIFIRKTVHEAVRAREAYSGYVVTGIRDTPIATAGFFDDWGDLRYSPEEVLPWNGPEVLFLVPTRRPPWINGGNRPGWLDVHNHFVGQVYIRVGIQSETGLKSGLNWTILEESGSVIAQGAMEERSVPPLVSVEVGHISWECSAPGRYRLIVEFGDARNEWPLNVFWPMTDVERKRWKPNEEGRITTLGRFIEIREDQGTVPMPFWREASYEFLEDAWGLANRWERLLPISPDRALDPTSLPEHKVVINRVDARTHKEHPIAVVAGKRVITTLRLFGGLGLQPIGIQRNPSGLEVLRRIWESLRQLP